MTDEELIAWVRNGFGNAAADRIETLVKADRAQVEVAEKQAETIIRINARAERLEVALRKIAEGNFIGRAEGYAFAALKGADHV